MATETVKIQDGEQVIELSGTDAQDFLQMQSEIKAESDALQAEAQAKADARESALAKLAALGLTQDEINAL